MAITAIAAATAGKKALENVTDDIYELGKDQFSKTLKHWKTKGNISTLYKKITNIRRVKTIWQVEKEVDLMNFYYPSKIKVSEKRKTIDDISNFDYEGNILIEGTIGQGKSIFFRYLTSQEMFKGNAIPVFVELRRVKTTETLVEHLLEEIRSLGLEIDEETFLFLAKHGKVILFLDAFDEVREGKRIQLITEIERLSKRYEQLRILISSRPNSGIEASPFFRVFYLSPLQGNEYEEVITKMAHDDKTAFNIIRGIKSGKARIRQLLTTPLMVALLMLRYRVEQSIPENAMAFYGDLFNILLLRHDKTKAGYVRARKSRVGDVALLQIFNGICFLTRKADHGAFMLNELQDYTKKAISIAGQKCSPDKVITDIIEITCLIVEEGGECKFIHKSVQEYHAACFIKEQPDELANKFYKAMADKWHYWDQELEFLSEIDKYRFLKYFAIPDMVHVLRFKDYESIDEWKNNVKDVFEAFGKLFVVLQEEMSYYCMRGSSWCLKDYNEAYVRAVVHFNFWEYLKSIGPERTQLTGIFNVSRGRDMIPLSSILQLGFKTKEVKAVIDSFLQDVQKKLADAQNYIKHTEDTKSVFEF